MNKILLIIIFLVFGLSNIKAQAWFYVGSSKNGDETYIRNHSTNTAWIKTISKKTEYYSEKTNKKLVIDGYTLSLYKLDCKEMKLGFIQTTVYNSLGEPLSTTKKNEYYINMEYALPDSMGEAYLKSFCEGK